jgi:cytoskeletal protein RodZ
METPRIPPSPPLSLGSSRAGSRRGGTGAKSSLFKSISWFLSVAGLLTVASWRHFLQEFHPYNDTLFQTTAVSQATPAESSWLVDDVSWLMDTAVQASATTGVAVTSATTTNESKSDTTTTTSAVATVKRKATTTTATALTMTAHTSSSTSAATTRTNTTKSKGLDRLTAIYEAIAKVTRHNGKPWPNPRKDNATCLHHTVWTRHEYAMAHNITAATTISAAASTDSTGTTNNHAASMFLTSSVEFVACCGLGHRLSRMAGAAHIAQELETTFLSHWGCCGGTDVFYDLFGFDPILFGQHITPRPAPPPPANSTAKPDFKHHLQFRFETTQFQALNKFGVKCPCSQDKIDSDFNFYGTLRNRYTRKHEVDAFVQKHFYNRTSIGLHIRAGNGETGDFVRKEREIADAKAFVQATIQGMQELLRNATTRDGSVLPPPVLFIATDTPRFIQDFRALLNGTMSVVELTQRRREEGQGVLFGEFQRVASTGDDCMGKHKTKH